MAVQTINVGALANDGTGDDLREAFIKANANFEDLDIRLSNATDIVGASVGEGQAVFKEQVGTTLNFRKLSVDPLFPETMAIRVSDDGNTLYFSSTQAYYRFTDGTYTLTSPVESVINLTGTQGAQVSVDNSTKTITFDSQIVRETAPQLNANLNADNNALVNVSRLNDILREELDRAFSWDFGELGSNRTSLIDWFINEIDVDFGTFILGKDVSVDLGLLPAVSP